VKEFNRKEKRMMDQSATPVETQARRLQIEYWPLDRFIPYARNARTHSPAGVKIRAKSESLRS
jgi:hypothetical protein